MANLSIKSKLLTMLLAVSLFSIATVASLNYYATYKALEASALSHLTSLRAARADQLEQLVERLRDETRMVAGNASIVEASRDFISAYRALENVTIDPSMDLALHQYYQQSFLPEYEKETGQVPELDPMLPATPAARYLQYQWMAHNPFPIAEKDKLVRADDDSAYSRAHEKWHPVITRLFDSLGFKGIVIVDIETGAIVYTRRKLPDFATRLSDGPWAHTHAAELFRRIQRAPERTTVDIEDFELFRPYFDEPSSFFATPIFDGGRAIAVLMLRLSTERIDQVMTGGHQWERDGLGKTGEAYVVGHDFRMRSNSRFLIEAPEQYAQALQQTGMPERDIAEIMREKSTILLQKVRSTAAQEALAGNEGTGPVVDYRGVDILGSWAPLHIAGLDWGIVAKINSDEAYAPMRKMARNTLIQTLLILLLITLVVMFLATSFVRPVNELIARVKLARSGNTDMAFAAESTDEIGDLARSFRELIDSVRKQTNLLEQVTTEHQQLLESVMPKGMAQRVKVSCIGIPRAARFRG